MKTYQPIGSGEEECEETTDATGKSFSLPTSTFPVPMSSGSNNPYPMSIMISSLVRGYHEVSFGT